MARAGEDPNDVLDRARQILVECDAVLFLPEVDQARSASSATLSGDASLARPLERS
jgi:hypothetical protein